jgi:hypothetical protein
MTDLTDWAGCTNPHIENVLTILKNTSLDIKEVYATFEAFLDVASEEEGYFLMVQIRLQLSGMIETDDGLIRRLDQVASQGSQSGTYLKAMQRIFGYIDREGKKLPVPPV